MLKSAVAMFIVSLLLNSAVVGAEGRHALPKDYSKWEKSRDKAVTDKSSLFYGIHNIYADAKAMKTYRKGGRYPEGSMFVVEQFAIKSVGGSSSKGRKSMVVMMRKDKRMKSTGGWYFAGFTPDGRPSGLDPAKNCFECHLRDAASTDYVISTFADFR